MTLTVYHLKTCDTCRKAIKALKEAGHDVVLVDVREDGIPESEFKRLVNAVGWETLLNTRSTTWRGLTEDETEDMDKKKAIALMRARPTLIKRPVIDTGTNVTVGWKKDVQDKLLN